MSNLSNFYVFMFRYNGRKKYLRTPMFLNQRCFKIEFRSSFHRHGIVVTT